MKVRLLTIFLFLPLSALLAGCGSEDVGIDGDADFNGDLAEDEVDRNEADADTDGTDEMEAPERTEVEADYDEGDYDPDENEDADQALARCLVNERDEHPISCPAFDWSATCSLQGAEDDRGAIAGDGTGAEETCWRQLPSIPRTTIHDMVMHDGRLYAALGTDGLMVVDVTDPTQPRILGIAPIPARFLHTVCGLLAVIADGCAVTTYRMDVLPDELIVGGSFRLPDGSSCFAGGFGGAQAHVASSAGLVTLDLRGRCTLEPVRSVPLGSPEYPWSHEATTSGIPRRLHATDNSDVIVLTPYPSCGCIPWRSGCIYSCSYTTYLLDASQPDTVTNWYGAIGDSAHGVAIDGNHLYASTEYAAELYNLEDPSRPRFCLKEPYYSAPNYLFQARNGLLYETIYYQFRLERFNVQNRGFDEVSRYLAPAGVTALASDGAVVALGVEGFGIRLVRIDGTDSVQELGTLRMDASHVLASQRDGDLVYLLEGDYGEQWVTILSVADRRQPAIVSWMPFYPRSADLWDFRSFMKDHTWYLVAQRRPSRYKELNVISMEDPTHPVLQGRYLLPAFEDATVTCWLQDAALDYPNLYVGCGEGIAAYDIKAEPSLRWILPRADIGESFSPDFTMQAANRKVALMNIWDANIFILEDQWFGQPSITHLTGWMGERSILLPPSFVVSVPQRNSGRNLMLLDLETMAAPVSLPISEGSGTFNSALELYPGGRDRFIMTCVDSCHPNVLPNWMNVVQLDRSSDPRLEVIATISGISRGADPILSLDEKVSTLATFGSELTKYGEYGTFMYDISACYASSDVEPR